MKKNHLHRPSEVTVKEDRVYPLRGWNLLVLGAFWWVIYEMNDLDAAMPSDFTMLEIPVLGTILGIPVLGTILGIPVFLFSIFIFIYGGFLTFVLVTDILNSIFGFREKEPLSIVDNKKPDNLVYEYTRPVTQTINPQLTQDSAKKLSHSTPVPKDKLPTSIPTEKILPPENFFNVPRKIDWDELNKTRKYNGDLGEVFVYDLEKNYLTKIGRSDLAKEVQHVASEGDGHGYDIKSFYENGSAKYIEVKATNASAGSIFNLSKNEFNFLQTHLNNAVVYHVHNVNNERETTVIIYPAGEVVNSPDISPSGYVVKM